MYILTESVSYEETVDLIVSEIENTIPELYDNLRDQAKTHFSKKNDMQDFGVIVGGVANRWKNSVFMSSLKPNLSALTKFRPNETEDLKSFLDNEDIKFNVISKQLPKLLYVVGENLNSKKIKNAAKLWNQDRKQYHEELKKLGQPGDVVLQEDSTFNNTVDKIVKIIDDDLLKLYGFLRKIINTPGKDNNSKKEAVNKAKKQFMELVYEKELKPQLITLTKLRPTSSESLKDWLSEYDQYITFNDFQSTLPVVMAEVSHNLNLWSLKKSVEKWLKSGKSSEDFTAFGKSNVGGSNHTSNSNAKPKSSNDDSGSAYGGEGMFDAIMNNIINDISGAKMSGLYDQMTNMMQEYYSNNGNLKGFGKVKGGVASRWINSVYFPHLVKSLHAFTEVMPKYTEKLKMFLREYPTGIVKFADIESSLVDALQDAAENMNSKKLNDAVGDWVMRINKFYNEYDRLQGRAGGTQASDVPAKSTKPKKSDDASLIASQNVSVNKIINDILKSLPKDVAHDIRMSIAKSDNKLAALQQEFKKRDIQINENYISNTHVLYNELKEMFNFMENSMTKTAKDSFCNFKTWQQLDNNNSTYNSYRFGVSLAGAPDDKMDKSGPVGGHFVTLSYSPQDDGIIKSAAKNMGINSKSHGSKKSKETTEINNKSPVAKRKPNKYGV